MKMRNILFILFVWSSWFSDEGDKLSGQGSAPDATRDLDAKAGDVRFEGLPSAAVLALDGSTPSITALLDHCMDGDSGEINLIS